MKSYRNIAFIIDTLETGGAENILVSLANNLAGKDFNIHLIATRSKGNFATRLKDNITIHELNKRPGWDFKAAKCLREVIHKNGIEVIHSHTHPSSYFITFAFLGRARDFKHILHSHYGLIHSNRTVRLKDKLFLSSTDHVIVTSELLYNYFTGKLKYTDKNCSLIYNGIAFPGDSYDRKSDSSTCFQILQTASINRNKNQLLSLKVCRILKERGFVFKWIFAGNYSKANNYFIELQEYIHENALDDCVEFKGDVTDIWTLIHNSDLGVLTSLEESMPLSAIEYVSGQLPCVFTPKGHLVDLADQYGTCHLLPEGDEKAWAGRIIELSSRSPDLYEAVKNNAIKAREEYSLHNMIEKVITVYSKLAAK